MHSFGNKISGAKIHIQCEKRRIFIAAPSIHSTFRKLNTPNVTSNGEICAEDSSLEAHPGFRQDFGACVQFWKSE